MEEWPGPALDEQPYNANELASRQSDIVRDRSNIPRIARLQQNVELAENNLNVAVNDLENRTSLPEFERAKSLFESGWRVAMVPRETQNGDIDVCRLYRQGKPDFEEFDFDLSSNHIQFHDGADNPFTRFNLDALGDGQVVLKFLIDLTSEGLGDDRT